MQDTTRKKGEITPDRRKSPSSSSLEEPRRHASYFLHCRQPANFALSALGFLRSPPMDRSASGLILDFFGFFPLATVTLPAERHDTDGLWSVDTTSARVTASQA